MSEKIILLRDDAPKLSEYVSQEERKQWIGGFPRINYLGKDADARCESLTRRGRQCKLRAQFEFTALKLSNAEDGFYCWNHLTDQLNDFTGREDKAVTRWTEQHQPPWQDRYNAWLEVARLEPA